MFEVIALGFLVYLSISANIIKRNQEKIMSLVSVDSAQLDQVNANIAQLVTDEATIKSTIATVLALLQPVAGAPVDVSGAITELANLHTALTADTETLTAAELTPATTPETGA